MTRTLAALFAFAAVAGSSFAQTPPPAAPPPAADSSRQASVPVIEPHAMVSAANPLAADAGLAVLRQGGSALDAAVAVQSVLGLVEPQSSGLGGGAFMVYYDAATKKVTAYDGREVAPMAATPQMFLGADGQPLPFGQAILSGRSAGVPGAIAMLYLAHGEHGKLPWKSLFGRAEQLASDGFTVSPRLDMMIHLKFAPQPSAPDAVRYFTKPDGTEYKAGDVLKNPAYAATLQLLAAEGPKALLTGKIAQDIVDKLHEGLLPGTMTLADLAAYKPHESEALCRPYRVYLVCTGQAPSGGPALLEELGLIEHTDIASRNQDDPQGWLEIGEAERLMYADRDKYEGDPAFVPYPMGLLDPAYLTDRAKLIGDTAGPAPQPGHPAGAALAYGPDRTLEPGGTSHFVIVDAAGDVVSMTTTVESIFGDGRWVDGFFLNNQLTDFSFAPKDPDGTPAANAVGPGKRPRSSMAPNIMLDHDGNFVAAVGSPGGNAIPSYVLKAIVGFIDWKLPMQQALDLPNLVARGPVFAGETDRFPPGVISGLAAKGVTLRSGGGAEGSGLHGIMKVPGGYEGGADDRREGVAVGF
ncbi:MAG TPA: gamma-glutamyltransferase family protein [Caulobacteraceae bacterium]|jgi:gamma-glutamyltranspeptidase/glutathione hydrolase